MTTAVSVSNLTVTDRNGRALVADISFKVDQGEFCGIVGASGSGKTTTALALLGHNRPGSTITGGEIVVAGRSMLSVSRSELQRLRGRVIAYVPQDARAAMTPTMRLGSLLDEALRDVPGSDREDHERDILALVGLSGVSHLRSRFPHQLSGGQLQRFALALVLAGGARVIVLDEPTSALDPHTRDALLDHIEQLRQELGLTIIMITHDLAGVSGRLTHVVRFDHGRLVSNDMPDDESRDQHGLSMLQAGTRSSTEPLPVESLLAIRQVTASYPGSTNRQVPVLRDINLDLGPGECVALIGPSGGGKSTLARCIVGLHETWDGEIRLDGVLLARNARQRPREQRRRLQMVFQNPYGSLNPREKVGDLIARPFVLRGERDHAADVASLLDQMRLPAAYADRYPHQLSGGERQRVAIACALASNPAVLICDEITSSLDKTTQRTIADLLRDIQRETNLTMLVITHDHGLAQSLGHRVLAVETGTLIETSM